MQINFFSVIDKCSVVTLQTVKYSQYLQLNTHFDKLRNTIATCIISELRKGEADI